MRGLHLKGLRALINRQRVERVMNRGQVKPSAIDYENRHQQIGITSSGLPLHGDKRPAFFSVVAHSVQYHE